MIDPKNIFVIEKVYNPSGPNQIKSTCMVLLKNRWIWKDTEFTLQEITYNHNPIPEKSKILFTKNALFPKFKLETTSFKRSIKPNTADCIVCGKLSINQISTLYLFLQCGEKLFLVYKPDIYTKLGSNTTQIDPIIKYLINNGFISNNYTILPYDKLYCYINPKSKKVDLNLLEDPKFKDKIYLDTDFNNQISKQANSLTDDNFTMIKDLFASRDVSAKELGLKTLCTFNWTECPLKIASLFVKFESSLNKTNAWNSVAVKTLLKNINYKCNQFYSYSSFLQSILYKAKQTDFVVTPIDKAYIQKELYDYISNIIYKTFNNSQFEYLNKFGIKFSYDLCLENEQNNTQSED